MQSTVYNTVDGQDHNEAFYVRMVFRNRIVRGRSRICQIQTLFTYCPETQRSYEKTHHFSCLLCEMVMERDEKLSLADFNRKLRKYCTSAVACAVKEKECISRLETIITKRDACLAHLAKEKEREMLLGEEIEDLQHQREDALEFFQMVEKRYQKYAAEISVNASKPNENVATVEQIQDTVDDKCPTEQVFKTILHKYCNLYVQFNKRSNIARVLSLEDNRYFEIDLNGNGSIELTANTWSQLGSSSVHLSDWEKLL